MSEGTCVVCSATAACFCNPRKIIKEQPMMTDTRRGTSGVCAQAVLVVVLRLSAVEYYCDLVE